MIGKPLLTRADFGHLIHIYWLTELFGRIALQSSSPTYFSTRDKGFVNAFTLAADQLNECVSRQLSQVNTLEGETRPLTGRIDSSA